jgi:nitrogen regulatory protein PII
MTSEQKYTVIVAIVERDKAQPLIKAATREGATGATVFFARGTGTHEHLSLLRININPMKEVVLILAENEKTQPVFDAVIHAGNLNDPGAGIVFTLPVGQIAGLDFRQYV